MLDETIAHDTISHSPTTSSAPYISSQSHTSSHINLYVTHPTTSSTLVDTPY